MSKEIRATLVSILIVILPTSYTPCSGDYTGVDIGNNCTCDTECKTGNGGEYSKCNRDLNICICTINHLGEDKCLYDSDRCDGVCRQQRLYTEPGYCTLECSPTGTIKWQNIQDWYGNILQPFALFIHDKKTSVCYDPLRAFNTVPEGFEIKQSPIPYAGLGVFTNNFLEKDTIFGPYKGIFEPDADEAYESGYSWRIAKREGEDRDGSVWVDAKDVTLSNWLRYINTPISAETENLIAVHYNGEVFYKAFKSIQPGAELLVWYGESYGQALGIESFDTPTYYHAKFGYVGGPCHKDDEGQSCLHDENTLCVSQSCLCIPGTHNRAGMCVFDETLGGICAGPDGNTCKHDINAECQGGVCVCKNNSSPAYGVCAPDERYQGRCDWVDGEECDHDQNAECWDSVCVCKKNASAINGICRLDGNLHGMCIKGNCHRHNTVCDSTSNTCICKATHFPDAGKCVRK